MNNTKPNMKNPVVKEDDIDADEMMDMMDEENVDFFKNKASKEKEQSDSHIRSTWTFFTDMVEVFNKLIANDQLDYRQCLYAIQVVLITLSGQGEALNIDLIHFYSHLCKVLFHITATRRRVTIASMFATRPTGRLITIQCFIRRHWLGMVRSSTHLRVGLSLSDCDRPNGQRAHTVLWADGRTTRYDRIRFLGRRTPRRLTCSLPGSRLRYEASRIAGSFAELGGQQSPRSGNQLEPAIQSKFSLKPRSEFDPSYLATCSRS
ncbi:hypothetical protein GHT06_008913 [Daphnia sinensis]|uniref:Uncharacterized protein n=1 Tax=Daphnia sinensis TaxID=1820382 RepID=A0AAD5Q362_9CRUS|nr:hypothetical protein GHT06_008913 [Daphnia sinensis]